ncbi:hypothetical protein [Methanosarcina sp.]|uniref:hypothetical protein n=1 Tax=Methanosarcina sp. TaxID=2213 RepID=UPI002AB8F241|nr:hypothetical protein [Methanosarcina sp.]MDY9926307.1 hypothetical protein [Methanosarcina sp.]
MTTDTMSLAMNKGRDTSRDTGKDTGRDAGRDAGQAPFSEEITHMTGYPEITESCPYILISKKENLKNLRD